MDCRLFRALRRIWKGWQFDAATDMAAEVSFYFVLSCFPFLMVLNALLAWLHESSGCSFSFWLTNYMPTSARDTVLTNMLELSKGSGRFVSFDFADDLERIDRVFDLMDSLSKVHGVPDDRSYLKRRLIAIVATLVEAVFLVLCFVVESAGHVIAGIIFSCLSARSGKWRVGWLPWG